MKAEIGEVVERKEVDEKGEEVMRNGGSVEEHGCMAWEVE